MDPNFERDLEKFLIFASSVFPMLVTVVLLFGVLWILAQNVVFIPHGHWMLVERFMGRTLVLKNSGLSVLIPFLEKPRKVHWTRNIEDHGIESREDFHTEFIPQKDVTFDSPPWKMSLSDNATITANALFWFRIEDIFKAVVEVDNLWCSLEGLVQAATYETLLQYDTQNVLQKRGEIEQKIFSSVNSALSSWGVRITQFKFTSLLPPTNVTTEIIRIDAERRKKLAQIESEKLTQEHELAMSRLRQQQQVEEAKTRAECCNLNARATADYYQSMRSAGASDAYLLAMKTHESWAAIAESGSAEVILPYDAVPFRAASRLIASSLSALGASE